MKHRAFNFIFRCLIFSAYCIRYFAFDLLPLRHFAFNILPLRYLAFDILPLRYYVISILCHFDILSLRYITFDILPCSIFCPFDILSFRYFVLSIFFFRYFIDIFHIRYFAIRYNVYSIFCDSMFWVSVFCHGSGIYTPSSARSAENSSAAQLNLEIKIKLRLFTQLIIFLSKCLPFPVCHLPITSL